MTQKERFRKEISASSYADRRVLVAESLVDVTDVLDEMGREYDILEPKQPEQNFTEIQGKVNGSDGLPDLYVCVYLKSDFS